MNKEVLEFIDVWMRSQKEFMESWMNAQKEFMDKWLEATRQMREPMLSMEGSTAKTQNLYRSWFETMTGSAKIFTDEAGKIQETWKAAVEKQMDMNKEVMKNFSELFTKAAEKK